MPLEHLLIIYLIGTLIVFLPAFGVYKLFEKASVPAWKAFVPFYNTWVMQDIAKRPKHWVFWQLIPVGGWFISMGIFIEFVKVFGKFSFLHHAGASLLAPFYFPYIANRKDTKFIGAEAARKHRKSGAREWIDAAVFAIVAATLIRLFIFEAYTIPTGSMEKSLLVNDFLFVSKISYGPRVPNTPLSIPKQFVLAYFKPGYSDENLENPQEKIEFYIDPTSGQVFTHKDVASYFKRISTDANPSFFKPQNNRSVIRHLIEESSKCFTDEKELYKQKELQDLANLLD